MLQSETLGDRHIAEINKFFIKNIYENEVTVLELLSSDILHHAEHISNIYETSVRERNIESTINHISDELASLEFKFEQDSESKLFIFISNMHLAINQIDSFNIQLYSITASKFSEPFAHSIETLIKKVGVLKSFLESCENIQNCYFKYRHFYVNSRLVRFMSASVKNFSTLDEFWKVMTKTFRDTPKIDRLLSPSVDLSIKDLLVNIEIVFEAAERVRFAVQNYIQEQCRKFPRLYLLSKSSIQDIFTIADFPSLIEKFESILRLDSLMCDRMDTHLTVGGSSSLENIIFKTPSSSRNSLIDWLRGLYHGMSEKLRFDIKELLDDKRNIFDDIKLTKSIDQARICYLQIKFWDHFSRDPKDIFELLEQTESLLGQFLEAALEYRTIYQRIAIHNGMIVITGQKVFLEKLCSDIKYGKYDTEHSFLIDCALKKQWDGRSSTINASIGDMVIR